MAGGAEEVRREHKVAWLVDAEAQGVVELSGGAPPHGRFRLVHRAEGTPDQSSVLGLAFARRTSIDLGRYDCRFAMAWRTLDRRLDRWREKSGYWDARSEKRCTVVAVCGAAVALVGAVVAFVVGLNVGRWDGGVRGLALASGAGLAAGIGLAATVGRRELRVRTPAGSAAWLRVEWFRRFLAASEAHHAEDAAGRGLPRDYTAWAVALGEIERWTRAVERSTADAVAGAPLVLAATVLGPSIDAAVAVPTGGHPRGVFGGRRRPRGRCRRGSGWRGRWGRRRRRWRQLVRSLGVPGIAR